MLVRSDVLHREVDGIRSPGLQHCDVGQSEWVPDQTEWQPDQPPPFFGESGSREHDNRFSTASLMSQDWPGQSAPLLLDEWFLRPAFFHNLCFGNTKFNNSYVARCDGGGGANLP